MRVFPHNDFSEFAIFKKLNTPQKIQDFLNAMPFNFEKGADTNRSPLETLRAGTAHCMEGAMLAAAILWYQGEPPLLLDLRTTNDDTDHVVALFKRQGKKGAMWGAISKTNHGVLRYRDPIYKTIRELTMSYFHEYFLNSNGEKTLREFSKPFDMSRLKEKKSNAWLTSPKDLWHVVHALNRHPHETIMDRRSVKNLRKADSVERKVGEIVEYKKK